MGEWTVDANTGQRADLSRGSECNEVAARYDESERVLGSLTAGSLVSDGVIDIVLNFRT